MSLENQILILRKEGKSYNEIKKIIGCTKSLVCYYCGEDQKNKNTLRRKKNNKKLFTKISHRVDTFRGRTSRNDLSFNKKYIGRDSQSNDFVNKIINNPICYLTGKQINLEETKSYCLDHIVPYSISQNNSIENMGICTVEVNKAKSDLTIKELLNLCKNILEYNGYEVNKTILN